MARVAPCVSVLADGKRTMVSTPQRDALQRLATIGCAFLVALPWFWPILRPPLFSFWVDWLSWAAGALLLSLLLLAKERAPLAIVAGWLVAALGSSVLALMQYLNLEDGFSPWIARTNPGMALANVHQPNMLATLLAVGLLCLVWFRSRGLATRHGLWMAALILAALAATASRTGVLHLLVVGALLLHWHRDQVRVLALLLLAAVVYYLLAAWALQWVGSVINGADIARDITSRFGADNHCHSRSVLWRNMLELIALKPWSGWGPGELLYAHYITPFEGLRYCAKLSNAHNLPLHAAFVLGVPLTLLLTGGLVYGVSRWRPWAARDATARLAWGSLLLIGVHSLLEFPLWYGVFQLMAGLALWLLVLHAPDGGLFRRTGFGALSSRKSMGIVSTLGLLLLAVVAWDYIKVSQLYLPASGRLEMYKTGTYEKARTAWFFQDQVLIAQVGVTPLTRENAHLILADALEALHVAPDARIIRRVIESAELLGRQDLVDLHTARYKAAWPAQFAEWQALRAPQNARSSHPASPSSAPR